LKMFAVKTAKVTAVVIHPAISAPLVKFNMKS
jgi:hypothetical protein